MKEAAKKYVGNAWKIYLKAAVSMEAKKKRYENK
jgi:hypothetical protein